ncbi:MAG: hypothetical protein NT067_03090 [Candidatus Diapherotrites archaeon]|nr:hypothetical protein [Candidatus Diapherotrites archaeon]
MPRSKGVGPPRKGSWTRALPREHTLAAQRRPSFEAKNIMLGLLGGPKKRKSIISEIIGLKGRMPEKEWGMLFQERLYVPTARALLYSGNWGWPQKIRLTKLLLKEDLARRVWKKALSLPDALTFNEISSIYSFGLEGLDAILNFGEAEKVSARAETKFKLDFTKRSKRVFDEPFLGECEQMAAIAKARLEEIKAGRPGMLAAGKLDSGAIKELETMMQYGGAGFDAVLRMSTSNEAGIEVFEALDSEIRRAVEEWVAAKAKKGGAA